MAKQYVEIDQFLAKALVKKNCALWPETWQCAAAESALVERALYHGIAGLLIEYRPLGWPPDVVERLRDQALAQAMWEMRHKIVVSQLLTELARERITAIILKGTAFAYDLYPTPATRARGDTDILVDRGDLTRTRLTLAAFGFHLYQDCIGQSDDLRLQETWHFTSTDGTGHDIDLHWQAMNSLALSNALTFADCAANARTLPLLSDKALTMERTTALIHACMHRAGHLTSPYFVDGVTYYGGDRLIWANDIHLLAGALSASEWEVFSANTHERGLAAVGLDGLNFARKSLATVIPADVMEGLAATKPRSTASTYLLGSGQAARAFQDFKAAGGLSGKMRYLFQRTLPPARFMRAKYPRMSKRPLALLYIRRVIDLLRERPERVET